LFIAGYPGEAPSEAFLKFVADEHIGGVILFGENCPTHLAARQHIETIRARCGNNAPLVAIDQEGGRVCRLRGAPVEYRAASEYGRDKTPVRFAEQYSRAAVYMEALGININLAPVADIFLDPENSCLKDRCFGETAEQVAQFVESAVTVSRTAGLLSCLKHFPGLGAAKNDPHKSTSEASYDRILWEQRERIPFAAGVTAGCDLIMTTHVRVPAFDKVIATGSERIVAELIRESLGFEGMVITDDLCMNGAAELGDFGERTVAAFNAGHDLLLFGQNLDASMQAFDHFRKAVERQEIDPARVQRSLNRLAGIKIKLGRPVLF
jgi:beta-N-acetylhexosaminidase